MISRKIRNFADDTRGAALLEAAIVIPLLLLLVFGAVLWGLTIWQQIALQQVAEMESRCATLPNLSGPGAMCSYATCGSGQACAVAHAFGLGASTSNFTNPPSAQSGATFCTAITNYANRSYVGFTMPLASGTSASLLLPPTLNAYFCQAMQ